MFHLEEIIFYTSVMINLPGESSYMYPVHFKPSNSSQKQVWTLIRYSL